jgi:hypothetical protein
MDAQTVSGNKLYEEALRIAADAKERPDRLREQAAITAAWLLSYSPRSEIARQSPLVHGLMLSHGASLLDAVKHPRGR